MQRQRLSWNLSGLEQAGVLLGRRNVDQEAGVVDLNSEVADWIVALDFETVGDIDRDSGIEGLLLWGYMVDEDLRRGRFEEFEDVEIVDHGDLRRDCRSEESVVVCVEEAIVFCPAVSEVSFLMVQRHPLEKAILRVVPEAPYLVVRAVLDLVRTDLGVLVWEHIELEFRVSIREEVPQGRVVLVLD